VGVMLAVRPLVLAASVCRYTNSFVFPRWLGEALGRLSSGRSLVRVRPSGVQLHGEFGLAVCAVPVWVVCTTAAILLPREDRPMVNTAIAERVKLWCSF
jgi:hypothetical protein